VRKVIGLCLTGALIFSGVSMAAEQKPKPATPAPHPAAPAAKPAGTAPPAGVAAHGPTAAGGAPHITTANPGGGAQHITTANPGGAAQHITTASPGGAAQHITTASPGGAPHATASAPGSSRPGVTAGHPGSPGAGGHAGPSSFSGHPAASGTRELHASNGAAVRTRADGSHSDVHDPKRGMDIHHGLDGNRRISVERADHSRVFAERGGRGYVQHPYMFQGREFGHRTYYANGHAYDRFYGRYPYHGAYLDVYAPARYYPYGFYGYAYSPWARPVPYAWGWAGQPWYGYYGAYYAPYPVYAGPAFWLTDYLVATSLQAAYLARGAQLGPVPQANPALLLASNWMSELLLVNSAEAAGATPALSADVKQAVADEIKQMVQVEAAEAKANAANQTPDPAANSIATLLSDNKPHVLVAGTDLDLVAGSGQECAISQADIVQVSSPPAADADAVIATVLAAKGGKECASATSVSIAISDLQDMQNHMREMIDQGMTELQAKQGQNGIPAAPADATGAPVQAAFASGAPPPDANAASEISKESSQADAAERDVTASLASSGSAGDGMTAPPTIALGQSIDAVTSALGNPSKVIDLGAKKIYTYPDMKIIFMNGKVSDVQ